MIQLRTDCLVFETVSGAVPCSAEQVAVELIGDSADWIDSEMLRNAAAGVLRYFKEDLGRESVTVGEFTQALARVLRGFGLSVVTEDAPPPVEPTAELDLLHLASESGAGFELAFYPLLRNELQRLLARAPARLELTGLRGCVKRLAAARRWCPRCRLLSDSIVGFLRRCLQEAPPAAGLALIIR